MEVQRPREGCPESRQIRTTPVDDLVRIWPVNCQPPGVYL